MDPTALLDDGFAWTAARIAAIQTGSLDSPTPCSRWDLEDLLEHTVDTLAMLTDAIDAPSAPAETVHALGPTRRDLAIAELAARNRTAWATPGVMDRSFELPMGTMPAPVVVSITLLELVVHGWDISQSTGEAADIPDALATTTLEFARQAIDDESRGDHFAADLDLGDPPSDRLVAFLGRKPL